MSLGLLLTRIPGVRAYNPPIAPVPCSKAEAAYATARHSLRRSIDRCVMRSTAALHEEQKPSRANAAQSSHFASSSAPAVSTIAARPRSFMIARVLPPLAAASRAIRDMSSGSCATARLSRAAWPPALVSMRPVFSASPIMPPALSSFTVSRAARTASAGFNRPVRRAALTISAIRCEPFHMVQFSEAFRPSSVYLIHPVIGRAVEFGSKLGSKLIAENSRHRWGSLWEDCNRCIKTTACAIMPDATWPSRQVIRWISRRRGTSRCHPAGPTGPAIGRAENHSRTASLHNAKKRGPKSCGNHCRSGAEVHAR
jgi:hypothetical protein